MLKVNKAAVEKAAEEKAIRSRRGKSAKEKGAQFERDIAKRFQERYGIELVRTPQSGGFAKNKTSKGEEFRGDIVPVDKDINLKVHIECKSQKSWNLHSWLMQAKEDAPRKKIPLVVFRRFKTPHIYVTISLEDFFKLVPSIKEE